MDKRCWRIKGFISTLLVMCLIVTAISGCNISNKHLEMKYDENKNDNIIGWHNVDDANVTDWDNATIASWSDVDEYSDWVYSEMIFDDITKEYPIIECQVIDFRASGKYFDGEKIYSMVGDKFDVNSFVAKYAIGTGVVVICVVLTVATAGGTTPICCFIAGAADNAVSHAIKGAAFGAAMKAISTAIKSEGNIEDSFYGALEGSSDGYVWGAIYGAISGGLNSAYCFLGDTPVMTSEGLKMISDVCVGDYVYALNENTGNVELKAVTQVNTSKTDTTVAVTTNGERIESTLMHPYLTKTGWVSAGELSLGDMLLGMDEVYYPVQDIELSEYADAVTTYTLCIDEYHNFMVGEMGLVVHNRCNINSDYAGKTFELKDPELAAKYPDGVPFTQEGFPDFSKYARESVKFDIQSIDTLKEKTCLTGNYKYDFDLANKKMKYSKTPAGFTWHHKEDKMTLELIPTDLHDAVRHTGGASLIRDSIVSVP